MPAQKPSQKHLYLPEDSDCRSKHTTTTAQIPSRSRLFRPSFSHTDPHPWPLSRSFVQTGHEGMMSGEGLGIRRNNSAGRWNMGEGLPPRCFAEVGASW